MTRSHSPVARLDNREHRKRRRRHLAASARETVFDAVERARSLGITVCVDVNYRAKLWEQVKAGPVLGMLASRADVLLATVDEARLILGDCRSTSPSELARGADASDHER